MVRSNYIEPDSRVEKEANSLAEQGHEVTLIGWNRSANYWVREDKKVLKDNTVYRVSFGAKAAFGAGMKSLPAYLKFQISLFVWLIKNRKKYDICHLCDFDTAFTGSHACIFTHKKFVFDIFDYLSTDANGFFRKWIKKLEDNIIDRADATIICTEQRREQIKGTRPKNLTIIHNSPNKISVEEKETLVNEGKVRIAYIGILQDYRLLKEMVHAVAAMPEVELHIGGFGKYEDFMSRAAETYSNIHFYGKLSYKDTLKLEQSCNILTAIYDPKIGNHRYAAPNKFYESLMLGKPVIMVKDTGMADVVEKESIGEVIEYTEEAFKTAVKSLIVKRTQWEEMGVRMKRIYEERYSWTEMEKRLLNLYEIVISS